MNAEVIIEALRENGSKNEESIRTTVLGWNSAYRLSEGMPDEALVEVAKTGLGIQVSKENIRDNFEISLGTLAFAIPTDQLKTVNIMTRLDLLRYQLRHGLKPPLE